MHETKTTGVAHASSYFRLLTIGHDDKAFQMKVYVSHWSLSTIQTNLISTYPAYLFWFHISKTKLLQEPLAITISINTMLSNSNSYELPIFFTAANN